jgi:F420-dependent oxidoreductase-like protein
MRKQRKKKWLAVLGVALAFLCISTIAVHAEATKRKVRFGIQTPPEVGDPEDLIKLWQEAEAWGYDTAWTFDHFMPISGNTKGPCHDGWMLLGALAAKTSKIRLGCLVTGNTYRNPAVLAKMATTVDHLSNGRLDLGIGAGWFEAEHAAYGIPFYTAKERARRLEESVQIIRSLWTEKETTFKGKYYQIDRAPFEPKPLQKPYPPILIGGVGKKWTLPIIAKYADAWNMLPTAPDQMTDLVKTLNGYCEKYKRDCTEIEKSYLTRLVLSEDPKKIDQAVQALAQIRRISPENAKATILTGNTEEVKKQVQAYIDAGITHIIIGQRQPYDREGLQRFAKDVMPAFR